MRKRNHSVKCSTCQHHHCLIRKHVEDIGQEEIEKVRHALMCKKGQQFIMEGAPVSGLFFLHTGKAKVIKTGINGKEQILRLTKEGETIGHRGFGTKQKYSIGAIALEETQLCTISSESMLKLLQKSNPLALDMMKFYAEELDRSETKVKTMAQMTVREKVVDTLLFLNRKFGRNSKGFIKLQLSRKEIGEYCGTSEEQVIRVISALKSEGQLTCSGKRIRIDDPERLAEEIDQHNFFLDN